MSQLDISPQNGGKSLCYMNTKEGYYPHGNAKDNWKEKKLSMMKERKSYNILATPLKRNDEPTLTIITEEQYDKIVGQCYEMQGISDKKREPKPFMRINNELVSLNDFDLAEHVQWVV